jgi:hypothetical protein
MGKTKNGKWCDVCKKQCNWDHFTERTFKTGRKYFVCKSNFEKNNFKSSSRKGKFHPRSKSLDYILNSLEYKRDRYLETKYGINLKYYNFLLNYQNNCCDICNIHKDKLKYNLCVDHCHTTSKIRGLLCRKCNKALGHFKDSIDIIEKAICYLEHHER